MSTSPPSRPRPRVLVVDDESSIGKVIYYVLRSRCDVFIEGDGAVACRRLLDKDEHFDVILLDVVLPNMNGIAIFEKLQIERRELADKVVMITGGAHHPVVREFLATCGRPFLEKPFDVDDLVTAVKAALDGQRNGHAL